MSLSRQIFSTVKNNLKKDTGVTFRVDDQCNLFLQVEYVGDVDLFGKNFFVNAFGNYSKGKLIQTPPAIHFHISLNDRFSALDFPRLYYKLYDAVRHELGHYWQYLDPNYVLTDDNTPIYNGDTISDYTELKNHIVSEQEIAPYISGLVFSAQKQRRPFTAILNENLDELFFENNATTKQRVLSSVIGREAAKIIQDITNRVISRAKQLYPQTRLT
jgi:hypothetical protein